MLKPYYETDLGKLYHGDCLEIMLYLEPVDLVLTDPPYGVNLGQKKRSKKMSLHGNDGYLDTLDDENIINDICLPTLSICRKISKRVVLTTGSKYLFKYPAPDALWGFYWPNGAGIGRWKSFTCWQPILCYGLPPEKIGCYPSIIKTTETSKKNGHPCPKPYFTWLRLLERIGGKGNVLDPFFGSGTTGIACEELNRQWLGIEISEKYCEIAANRIEKERSQLKLFDPLPEQKKAEQLELI